LRRPLALLARVLPWSSTLSGSREEYLSKNYGRGIAFLTRVYPGKMACAAFSPRKAAFSVSSKRHCNRRNAIPFPDLIFDGSAFESRTAELRVAPQPASLNPSAPEAIYCGFGLGFSRCPSAKFNGSSR
jgi:hypothetical protein